MRFLTSGVSRRRWRSLGSWMNCWATASEQVAASPALSRVALTCSLTSEGKLTATARNLLLAGGP